MLGRLILGPGKRTAEPVPADVTLKPNFASRACAAIDRFWFDAQTTQNKTLLSEDEPATTPLTAAASIVGVGAGIVVEDADADDVGGYGGVVDDDEDICTA